MLDCRTVLLNGTIRKSISFPKQTVVPPTHSVVTSSRLVSNRARRRVFFPSFVLLIVSPGLARGTARHRRTWSRWATKQTCTSPTVPPIIRYCQELPTYRAFIALDGNISSFAFGPF